MSSNLFPTPYSPKSARTVGEVGGYRYVAGPIATVRASRAPQWFAEERQAGRTVVRRRFPSEQLALAQVERWMTFRKCQAESPL